MDQIPFAKSKDLIVEKADVGNEKLVVYRSQMPSLLLKATKEWKSNDKGPSANRTYFEIQVVATGQGKISFGLIATDNCVFEYQADGQAFCDKKRAVNNFAPRWDQKLTVVGCGVDFKYKRIFFVAPDGSVKLMHSKATQFPDKLIPFVGLSNKNEQIAVNFGEREFKYDPFLERAQDPVCFLLNPQVKGEIEGKTLRVSSIEWNSYASLQANTYWRRSGDKTPYFEIKIVKAGCMVGLGVSDSYFSPKQAVGRMQNSIGWADIDAEFDHLTERIRSEQKTGDIIGCGIAVDSFNCTRLFFTLNGKWLGFTGRKIVDVMECYPTISIRGGSELICNFGETKFAWDSKKMPQYTQRSYINALPKEILQIILEYASHNHAFVAQNLSRINKKWYRMTIEDDDIWRRLYYAKFLNQNPNLKVKDWYKFFKQRAMAMKTVSDPHPIENCSLAFKCPTILEKFQDLQPDETKRFCDACERDVYIVTDEIQLREHILLGRCVAIKISDFLDDDNYGGLFA